MFFCDLYNKDANTIPPEMIPYTQVLYYRDPAEGFNAKYQPLIAAPFSGVSSSRVLQTAMNWTHDSQVIDARDGAAETSSTKAAVARKNNQVKAAQDIYEDMRHSSLSDRKKRQIADKISGLTWLPIEVRNLARDILAANGQAANEWERLKNFMWGQAASSNSVTETDSSGTSQNVAVSTKVNHYIADAKSYLQRLDSASVTLNNIGGYLSDEGLTINQSIICKSSNREDAQNCLAKMANTLYRVAPRWYHVALKKQEKDIEFSQVNLVYEAPNRFAAQFKPGLKKNGGQKDSWSAFEYQGDFQLRQGYEVHQHLVPKSVVVTMSPDYLRLDDDPFSDIDKYSGFKSTSHDTSQDSYSPETILKQWKAAGLYKSVPLYSKQTKQESQAQTQTGYLFPQWVNISISLTRAEPYDGINGVQQMFCFGGTEAIQE